nr:immunoglobulin heavy chain junction region [Macaca mulatta]MOX59592.1 immunoglobulin heavy chain junction region [Macaca mulatta]MOX60404.1 immunoglobulin heavy chain junction region [Macaca mulatta]MOX60622.1 immunoglobulin heavy chain junction region [Macaca mulatta]MOX67005.1 immunoglobulin heavy chain junction region [Macaca mulatta]
CARVTGIDGTTVEYFDFW